MASGKVHEKINIFIVLSLIIVISIAFYKTLFIGVFLIGYVVGTYWLNPDLDIESRPYNRWGILKVIWKPYQRFKHRSVWTHGYVIGDIIRFVYLLCLIYVSLMLISFIPIIQIKIHTEFYKLLFEDYRKEFLFFFLGSVFSSSVHIFSDQVSSFLKRVKKKRKN